MITIIFFSLHEVMISSLHTSAQKTSIINLFLCVVLGRKVPGGLRGCWPTCLCPLSFYQRLTGYSWGTKHSCSNIRLRWIPLFLKGHTWKLRSATTQFHAAHSCSSQMSQGFSHEATTHKSTMSHIPVAQICKCMYVCISNLSPSYIVFQCNLFCTQD